VPGFLPSLSRFLALFPTPGPAPPAPPCRGLSRGDGLPCGRRGVVWGGESSLPPPLSLSHSLTFFVCVCVFVCDRVRPHRPPHSSSFVLIRRIQTHNHTHTTRVSSCATRREGGPPCTTPRPDTWNGRRPTNTRPRIEGDLLEWSRSAELTLLPFLFAPPPDGQVRRGCDA